MQKPSLIVYGFKKSSGLQIGGFRIRRWMGQKTGLVSNQKSPNSEKWCECRIVRSIPCATTLRAPFQGLAAIFKVTPEKGTLAAQGQDR